MSVTRSNGAVSGNETGRGQIFFNWVKYATSLAPSQATVLPRKSFLTTDNIGFDPVIGCPITVYHAECRKYCNE
jgi:hypothetical protein